MVTFALLVFLIILCSGAPRFGSPSQPTANAYLLLPCSNFIPDFSQLFCHSFSFNLYKCPPWNILLSPFCRQRNNGPTDLREYISKYLLHIKNGEKFGLSHSPYWTYDSDRRPDHCIYNLGAEDGKRMLYSGHANHGPLGIGPSDGQRKYGFCSTLFSSENSPGNTAYHIHRWVGKTRKGSFSEG